MRSAARAIAKDAARRAAFEKECARTPGGWNAALGKWDLWADERQRPPAGEWRVWLLMAGRGFGKTRAGAEWVQQVAMADSQAHIALVGATRAEVRAVMVDGASGILSLRTSAAERPTWQPTRGRLVWPNGAQATIYSGERPESLRGPQFSHAWCDEIAKWSYPTKTWDNLTMALRMGEGKALVTTTPLPIVLLKRIRDQKGTATVTGRTRDNRLLSDGFLDAMDELYGGTRLGRQELDGELIDDLPGALWSRAVIEESRAPVTPPARRVVIGVDPPAGALSGEGDACGIVAVALGENGIGYVLDDASVAANAPEEWARAVARCAARHGADRVVAEANNGGKMVESVLRAADSTLPLTLVHAAQGKVARAEPVSLMYERGQVRHVGAFPALEDELCGLMAGGGYDGPGRSPDRADALVWALSELMLGTRGEARVTVL